MPILLRAAALSDLEPGERRKVRVRGEKIVLVLDEEGAVRAYGTDCFHAKPGEGAACRHYRTQVRGGFVYVALDPEANAAPADIHASDRAPTPAPGPRPHPA
jgi:nitrite reductase/ring-hydroxylating ferredoxin subunit